MGVLCPPMHHKRLRFFGYTFGPLSSDMSSTCPHNMVNFGPLTAEIDPVVRGTHANFNGFRYCTASCSGRQPNFAALNRGRHLCSAWRPSRWALTHILVIILFYKINCHCCSHDQYTGLRSYSMIKSYFLDTEATEAYVRLLQVMWCDVLFCSLAFLYPSVGHTMDVLSPFISILCQ